MFLTSYNSVNNMEDVPIIENFHGVYLLYCLNAKYTGRTYIGYTIDPNRRIKQHNKGKKYGGAWKTSNRGPWTMVMIIHGFPNSISALRFEWAWQHPQLSTRLQHVPKKKPREKIYDFCLKVLLEMLKVGPWNRLPLTIQWLHEDFAREFPIGQGPPMHMLICHGPVLTENKSASYNDSQNPQLPENWSCFSCFESIEIDQQIIRCLNPDCSLISHLLCMSKYFLSKGQYVPIEGDCPKCKTHYLWGDIIRKYRGYCKKKDIKA